MSEGSLLIEQPKGSKKDFWPLIILKFTLFCSNFDEKQKNRFRSRLIFAFTLVFSISGIATGAEHGRVATIGSGENSIDVIYLWGNPYDMGYAHGSMLKEKVRSFFDVFTDAMKNLGGVSDEELDRVYGLMEPYIPEEYKEEMRGLADGADVPLDLVHRVHIIPDLSEFHCTFFAAWDSATKDGKLYQIRALDYEMRAHIQDYPAIIIYDPEGGIPFANIGWVGFIGVVSGISSAHIAVSEIGESFGDEHETLEGEPMPFLLRDILQKDDSLDKAVERIKNANRTSSYLYCVGDAELGEARSFETAADFCKVYDDSSLPLDRIEDVVYTSMGMDSGWNSKVYNFLNPKHRHIDADVAMDLMKTLGTGNLHSVAYNVTDLEIWVANAGKDRTPGFNREFVYLDLKGAFESFEISDTGIECGFLPLPTSVSLGNFPNPFSSETKIKYTGTGSDFLDFSIYNPLGRKVRTMLDETLDSGTCNMVWDGRDDRGNEVGNGVYIFTLMTDGGAISHKAILLR